MRRARADAGSWATRDDRAVTCRNEPVRRAAARFGMEVVPPSERNSPPLVARLWPALIFG